MVVVTTLSQLAQRVQCLRSYPMVRLRQQATTFHSKYLENPAIPCTATLSSSKMDDLLDSVLSSKHHGSSDNHHPCRNENTDSVLAAVSNDTDVSITTTTTSPGWRMIDWKALADDYYDNNNNNDGHDASLSSSSSSRCFPPASPVESVLIRDRMVYIKRDDLLRLPVSQLSGNKARKMFGLHIMTTGGTDASQPGMKQRQAPPPPPPFPQCIVSHGGPQSNAMLALAAMVHFQNLQEQEQTGTELSDAEKKRFVYYTKRLPRFLRNQPNGNLFRALSLGMELRQVSNDQYQQLFGGTSGGRQSPPPSLEPPVPNDSVWVPQGGASAMALLGTRVLAHEIVHFWSERQARMAGKQQTGCLLPQPLSVVLPGGTCSTALCLHRAIQDLLAVSSAKNNGIALDIQVVVVPCVGDQMYARQQMLALNEAIGGPVGDIPAILGPSPMNAVTGRSVPKPVAGYFRFGEPDLSIMETYREMEEEHQIPLDLLYGAPAWTILFRHWKSPSSTVAAAEANNMGMKSFDPASPITDRQIMYVHSGGLEGINSQLLRYKHKQLLDIDEIQLPGRRGDMTHDQKV